MTMLIHSAIYITTYVLFSVVTCEHMKITNRSSSVSDNNQESCKRTTMYTIINDFGNLDSNKMCKMYSEVLCINSKHVQPDIDIQENNVWYRVKRRKVIVYSAFYEHRKEADGPSIRIVAAGYQKAYNNIGPLYCQMWYYSERFPVSVLAEYHVIYPSTLHTDMWCSHFIICKLPPGFSDIPYAVSITPEPCCIDIGNILKVLSRIPQKSLSNTFGVCLSPIYNNFRNWTMVIEMFEIHKLLGADEIVIYNNHVDRNTNRVLESYRDDPEANVRVLPWAIDRAYVDKTNVNLQRAALNDCLYRLGQRHKFVTIQDLDEVLVPRKSRTWHDLFFNDKVYHPDIGIYMFQHYYFRRNETMISNSDDPYFITQSSFWRTEAVFPKGKVRCKSLYNAEKAVSVDLHYHYRLTPGAVEYMVNPVDGALHHYRNQPMNVFRDKPETCPPFVEDRYMSFYTGRLHEGYNKRLKLLEG